MEETEDVELLIGAVEEPMTLPVPAKKKKHNTKPLPDDKIASIYNLSQEGKSCAEIGEILGIGKSTASLLLRKKQKSKPVVEKKMDDAFVSQFVAEVSAPTPSLGNSKSSKDKELDKFLETFVIDDGPVKMPKPRGRAKKNLLDDFTPLPQAVVARPVVPKEPEMDKGMLITKIHINVENFGEVLKDYIKPNKEEYLSKVSKMGISELKSTLNLLDTTRISTSMAMQMKHLLFGAAAAIEFGTSKILQMKTEGYAEMIRRQDMEIQSCLREIALNNIESYKGMGLEKPQTRLATLMVMSLLSLDSRNRVAAMQTRQANVFVQPATEQKYADL